MGKRSWAKKIAYDVGYIVGYHHGLGVKLADGVLLLCGRFRRIATDAPGLERDLIFLAVNAGCLALTAPTVVPGRGGRGVGGERTNEAAVKVNHDRGCRGRRCGRRGHVGGRRGHVGGRRGRGCVQCSKCSVQRSNLRSNGVKVDAGGRVVGG